MCIRDSRKAILARPGLVEEILADGGRKARISITETMKLVRAAMHMD